MYLLDTNTCTGYLNGTAAGVMRQMKLHSPADICVCSIVRAELSCRAFESSDPVRTLLRQRSFLDQFVSLPFDDRAAEIYGRVQAHLVRQGTPIGLNNGLIAAIALANKATLVTSNTREFGRVPGLPLSDWETP
jgi:tRNA(fMet)-specific endonuclease VapC